MYEVIIIGSGPAGLTAGIYAVRSGLKTLVIAGDKWGGQLMFTTLVENYPGFAEGIQGPQLMMEMRKQAERLGVEILSNDFTQADFSQKPFKVVAGEKIYQGKSVIIASGADSIWLEVPGEEKLRGKGVSVCATCDAFFFRGKDVAVVGGGDSAIEEALVLAKVAKSVTVIHRRNQFRASNLMQKKLFAEPKIRVVWNGEVIQFNGENKLESVLLSSKLNLSGDGYNSELQFRIQDQNVVVSPKDFERKIMGQFNGKKILERKNNKLVWEMSVDGVFEAIGHKPNSDKLKGIELDAKGYIVRQEIKDEKGILKYRSATNIPGVFVAGDVHDYRYRQAVTAAGFGCMAALDAVRWLEEKKESKI